MDPELVRFIAVAMGGTVGIIGVIGWAVTSVTRSRALAAQNQPAGADPERIQDLEMRLAELEERVDFSERLLADKKRSDLGA